MPLPTTPAQLTAAAVALLDREIKTIEASIIAHRKDIVEHTRNLDVSEERCREAEKLINGLRAALAKIKE